MKPSRGQETEDRKEDLGRRGGYDGVRVGAEEGRGSGRGDHAGPEENPSPSPDQGGEPATYAYRDFSHVAPTPRIDDASAIGGGFGARGRIPYGPASAFDHPSRFSIRLQRFPTKLYDILRRVERFGQIISWLPHGRSWRINKPHEFEAEVMPHYFEHCNYHSFNRLVNAWSFRRVSKGPDKGSYYHELFLRGMPHLHQHMHRLTRAEKKEPAVPGREPDFYAISEVHPLPDVEPIDPDEEDQQQRRQWHIQQQQWPVTPPSAQTLLATDAPMPMEQPNASDLSQQMLDSPYAQSASRDSSDLPLPANSAEINLVERALAAAQIGNSLLEGNAPTPLAQLAGRAVAQGGDGAMDRPEATAARSHQPYSFAASQEPPALRLAASVNDTDLQLVQRALMAAQTQRLAATQDMEMLSQQQSPAQQQGSNIAAHAAQQAVGDLATLSPRAAAAGAVGSAGRLLPPAIGPLLGAPGGLSPRQTRLQQDAVAAASYATPPPASASAPAPSPSSILVPPKIPEALTQPYAAAVASGDPASLLRYQRHLQAVLGQYRAQRARAIADATYFQAAAAAAAQQQQQRSGAASVGTGTGAAAETAEEAARRQRRQQQEGQGGSQEGQGGPGSAGSGRGAFPDGPNQTRARWA